MAIKNKRTSVKKVTTDNRLKKKLKEDYDNFLHEEDDELPVEDGESEEPVDAAGSEDIGGEEGGDDLGMEGGEEDLDMGDDFDEDGLDGDLTPTEEDTIDAEVDELLGGSLAPEEEDDFSLEEDDDMMMEDEFDGDGEEDFDSDLDLEEPADEVGDLDDEVHNHGVHVDHGDDMFTADELNDIIDSPDTIHDLDHELVQKVTDMDEDGLEGEDDDFNEEDYGYDPDLEEGDDYMHEDAGDHKDPITGLKGEDHGNFGQGYEGGKNKAQGFQVKDELMEADVMKALGWEEEKPRTEGKNGKVTKDAKTGNIPTKKNLGDGTFGKVSDTVKESIKKSKMLVKAAAAILKLKEANQKLQVENLKLTKVNGILGAIGEKLTKATRKKIAESFSKCKSEKEINIMYEKVVKAVRKNQSTSLNEAVQKKKTVVNTKTVDPKTINEGSPIKVKKELNEDMKRKAFLMGLTGFDDQYFS